MNEFMLQKTAHCGDNDDDDDDDDDDVWWNVSVAWPC